MKILSLTQPWASLVAAGAKTIETRSWATPYRGWIGIHASKGFPKWAKDLCKEEPFATQVSMLRQNCAGEFYLADVIDKRLPLGQILCVCRIETCVPTERVRAWRYEIDRYCDVDGFWHISAREEAFGDYGPDRFAWVLSDIRPLAEPIPAKGALGLWECDDPRLLEAIR